MNSKTCTMTKRTRFSFLSSDEQIFVFVAYSSYQNRLDSNKKQARVHIHICFIEYADFCFIFSLQVEFGYAYTYKKKDKMINP